MRLLAILMLALPLPAPAQVAASGSTCVQCHQELDDSLVEAVKLSSHDIHFQKGLSCHSCHGGDPTVGVDTGGPEDSMSRAKGYIGIPARRNIAALCASCHSKLDYMRRFNPQARVDQLEEYLTSVHGKKYRAGNPDVATCTDCHGAHGVRSVTDPVAPVYPVNVAETCARCHSDVKIMAPYGMPTDQMELYRESAHGETLLKNRDISAPTCNDCHGNHGATPPGVDSVANVCGQCHVSQWEMFNQSPHQKAFAEFQLPACVTCHEHHAIRRTSDDMLGVEEPATCGTCHDKGTTAYDVTLEMKAGILRLQEKLQTALHVLERAERAGMEVSRPQFDLVEGRDRLVSARVEIHRFDLAALRKILDEGEKIAADSEQSGWKALDDLSFRRKGLAVSVVIILLMIGLVVVKIRQIER